MFAWSVYELVIGTLRTVLKASSFHTNSPTQPQLPYLLTISLCALFDVWLGLMLHSDRNRFVLEQGRVFR